MNNYEHIMQGGIDALLEYVERGCDICIYGAGSAGCRKGTCADGKRKWLESEYIEPDTQERINEDATKYACRYFGNSIANCGNCPASKYKPDNCGTAARLDLLSRQRRLDGVEK